MGLDFKSPAGICKIAITVLSFVVFSLTMYVIHPDKGSPKLSSGYPWAWCFIYIVTICFVLSLTNLVASFMLEVNKQYDEAFHGIACILVLVGGVLFTHATSEEFDSLGMAKPGTKLIIQLITGLLAIIEGIAYGAAAHFIGKG